MIHKRINKKKVIAGILILIGLIIMGAVVFLRENPREVVEPPFVVINNKVIHVDIAETPDEERRGLSGREMLPENDGMLFLFPEKQTIGFWMKEMKFPIDIVWISGNTIIGIEKNIDPQKGAQETDLKVYYPQEPIDRVLEINAGKADEWGMSAGDDVAFNRR